MSAQASSLTRVAAGLCGALGLASAAIGLVVTALGVLADTAQLKLDTNLDRASVIWAGLGVLCLGVALSVVAVAVWFWSRRH